MTKSQFISGLFYYNFLVHNPDIRCAIGEDPIIDRSGEIDDEPIKEPTWFEEEGDRQDDNPNI